MSCFQPEPAASPQRIAVAGAGLLGRLLAWQLLRAGHRVSLFDRDRIDGRGSAAQVAAAMLAPYSELVASEPSVFHWGRESLELWPALLAALAEHSDRPVALQQRGSVVVAHPADRANLLHFNQQLAARLASAPVADSAVQLLDAEALARLEPELAGQFQQGTFLPEEGCIDNTALLAALAEAILALGGDWHADSPLEGLAPFSVTLQGESRQFDWVLDCRGTGARQQLSGLRAVRGEVLWVQAPEVNLSRPVRLMHPRYQLYIAPKPENVYVIGATEIESDAMTPITVRSSLELQSALYSVHRGFAEAHILHADANCRPAFADNLPRIDSQPGLLSVNGLYRHGYLLAPVVVREALALLADENHRHRLIAVAETQSRRSFRAAE